LGKKILTLQTNALRHSAKDTRRNFRTQTLFEKNGKSRKITNKSTLTNANGVGHNAR